MLSSAQTVSCVVERLKEAFEDVENFLMEFAKRGFMKKMYHDHVDGNQFAELDERVVQLSSELGTALDIQVRIQ